MGKAKEYINKIVENGKDADMNELSSMLVEAIDELKDIKPRSYDKAMLDLYELAYGCELNEEMAHEWVNNMKPAGEHWSMDQTSNAMKNLGYNLDELEYYVVANMMFNDYYEILKANETLALKMAKCFLEDVDAVDNKVYKYYKYIVNK